VNAAAARHGLHYMSADTAESEAPPARAAFFARFWGAVLRASFDAALLRAAHLPFRARFFWNAVSGLWRGKRERAERGVKCSGFNTAGDEKAARKGGF